MHRVAGLCVAVCVAVCFAVKVTVGFNGTKLPVREERTRRPSAVRGAWCSACCSACEGNIDQNAVA